MCMLNHSNLIMEFQLSYDFFKRYMYISCSFIQTCRQADRPIDRQNSHIDWAIDDHEYMYILCKGCLSPFCLLHRFLAYTNLYYPIT